MWCDEEIWHCPVEFEFHTSEDNKVVVGNSGCATYANNLSFFRKLWQLKYFTPIECVAVARNRYLIIDCIRFYNAKIYLVHMKVHMKHIWLIEYRVRITIVLRWFTKADTACSAF